MSDVEAAWQLQETVPVRQEFDESPFQQSEELLMEDGTQCRPGEGPPQAPSGPRPMIFQSTSAAIARNPSVGYAQQLLNRFLDRIRAGNAGCTDTQPATATYLRALRGQLESRRQFPLTVDCRFGPATELATKMFQACRGLVRDGKIGPRTWPLLEALAGASTPTPAQPTAPAPQDTVRVREDVWTLSAATPWHPVLLWYARAVAGLKARTDTNDPRAWMHLAWIHGHPQNLRRSPAGAPWNDCEHGSWHFLPWHRAYLHHFERIVRDEIVRLGGPASWALPYWNYSDATRTGVRSLPPAFLTPTTPDNLPNPLREERRDPAMNRGLPINERIASVSTRAAFAETEFYTQFHPGFGGRPMPVGSHEGNLLGTLERTPHGDVHMAVAGFMANFETAGQDPIFWLHHANIDRLWEEWLRRGSRRNPTEPAWLDGVWTFGSGSAATTLRTSDVLDPRGGQLRYRYADMPVAPTREAFEAEPGEQLLEAGREPVSEGEGEREARPPELVGGTTTATPIGSSTTSTRIDITAPTGPLAREMSEAGAPPPGARVFLRLENITGTTVGAGSVEVHVNLPEGARPEDFTDRLAGLVSMFGVREASRRTEQHSGGGIDATFDITQVVRALAAAGQWDPQRMQVRFTPIPSPGGLVPEGDVKVGRVSLFYA